ncbi:MAG: ATP-dependent sacrificial sulfur transferase LarE [Desulfobacteraceae bacterium]|nr:ATP-dependent sacrificial sulfur transferase LarE [Desulfobacteraceae bacterium]MBC2752134.1 ATP-dependent sacrificial sulfur transferase LarE [Desulfobacteraceae bacterium]
MTIRPESSDQYDQLKNILKPLPSLAVAFSGGVDSSLLLAAAVDALGGRVVALTADSPVHPAREIRAAIATVSFLNVRHVLVRTDEMDQSAFRANTPDRCYICKKIIFKRLMAVAAGLGIERLAHGVNRDDFSDYRPGLQAAAEMKVMAPLVDAGLSKADIRRLAKARGLPNWNRPAMACLASRIPYDTVLSPSLLARVEAAERVLEDLGLRGGRVRCHGDVARIELPAGEDMARVLSAEYRSQLVQGVKTAGFTYVALDLEGYRQGSMNAPLEPRDDG